MNIIFHIQAEQHPETKHTAAAMALPTLDMDQMVALVLVVMEIAMTFQVIVIMVQVVEVAIMAAEELAMLDLAVAVLHSSQVTLDVMPLNRIRQRTTSNIQDNQIISKAMFSSIQ